MKLLQYPIVNSIKQYYASPSNRLLSFLGALALLGSIEVLLQVKGFGQICFVLYGLVAIFKKIKSEESFKLALITFGAIMLSAALGGMAFAKAFAVYAFLLLVTGVVCSIREIWRETILTKKPLLGLPAKRRIHFVSRRKRLRSH